MSPATATRNGAPPRIIPGKIIKELKLPAPQITELKFTLEGVTPLITDAFSEERKLKLERTQDGSPKQKPGPRQVEDEFRESQYRTADGAPGVPKLAFRKAIQAAAIRMTEIKGTEVLAAFQIDTPEEYLPLIVEGPPKMRRDHVVRVGRGNLAYRSEWFPWSVVLPIRLDHEVVTIEQLYHIVAKAGMGVGIGNWRPEKKGDFGMWKVTAITDVFVTEEVPV